MRLYLICESRLVEKLNALRPQLAAAAQQVYDLWDDSGQGICDSITEAWQNLLAAANIDHTIGGQEGDDHSYLVAYDDAHSYVVDIPPHFYETGGGYSWSKIPDITFSPNDITIAATWRPDWIDDESF